MQRPAKAANLDLKGSYFSFNAFLSGKGNTAYPMAIDFNSQTHWHPWNINDDKEEGEKAKYNDD